MGWYARAAAQLSSRARSMFWPQGQGSLDLLDRIRMLFYVFGIFTLLSAVPTVLASPVGGHNAGLAALGALAWLWTVALRRRRLTFVARLLEVVALLGVSAVAVVPAAMTGIFYVGLYFGALFGSRAATLTRAVAYFVAFAGAHVVRGGLHELSHPQVFAHSWGALASSLVMALLAEHVLRQEASEKAKDEFLAVVSHELRTPLTSFLGFVYTLERFGDRLPPERQQELLVRARMNAERQQELVESLLEVSQVLGGTLRAAPAAVALAPLADEVVSALGLVRETAVQVDPHLVTYMDRMHLQHMLHNLLSNATKYGAAPFEIRARIDDDHETITLSVRDHGPGIPPTYRERLFERFSQASTGDQRTATGLGLGLWTTRELARANAATVGYEDAQPGACFSLRLPADTSSESSPTVTQPLLDAGPDEPDQPAATPPAPEHRTDEPSLAHAHGQRVGVRTVAAALGRVGRPVSGWLGRMAPDGLLARVRWLFLALGLIVVATSVIAVAQATASGPVRQTIAVAAIVTWTAWMFHRYAHPTAHPVTDLISPVALVVMGWALGDAGPVFAPAYVLLFFRAMFGSRREALPNALLYFAAFHTTIVVERGWAALVTIDAVSELVAFVTVGLVMQSLGEAAGRHELGGAREQALTAVSSRLLRARTLDDVYRIGAEGALELIGDRHVSASIWIGNGVLDLVATAGADMIDLRRAPLDEVPEDLMVQLLAGRPYVLGAEDTRRTEDAYGHPHRFEELLFGPLLRDDEVIGTVLVASPTALDRNLLGFVERFANEISMAVDRAGLVHDLERANHELRRADELKNRFLSTVSHELRTPLTSIRGFAQTLRRQHHELSAEERVHFLGIIERQSARQERLVGDLLTISQVVSGRLRVQPEMVDVPTVIEQVLEELQVTSEQAQVTCRGTAVAYVDPDHLHQVLVNLITNARKYGEPPYVIDVHVRDETLQLTFTDHGAGIPAHFRSQLFEPFSQADERDRGTASGVGLGLAIVKHLIVGNGGQIIHRPDRPGACFEITLPAAGRGQGDEAGGGTADEELVGAGAITAVAAGS